MIINRPSNWPIRWYHYCNITGYREFDLVSVFSQFIFVGKATWNCRKCCELVIDVTLKWTVYPWAVFYDCINCYPIRYHGKSSPTGLPWIQAVQRGDQRGPVWTGEQDRQPRNLVQAKHNGWHSFGHANFRLNLSQILTDATVYMYMCTCTPILWSAGINHDHHSWMLLPYIHT